MTDYYFGVFIIILQVVHKNDFSDSYIHLDFHHSPFQRHSLHCLNHNWVNSGKSIHHDLTNTIFQCVHIHTTLHTHLFYIIVILLFFANHSLYDIIIVALLMHENIVRNNTGSAAVCLTYSTFYDSTDTFF